MVNKKQEKKMKIIASMQIALLMLEIFAFSYLVEESSNPLVINGKGKFELLWEFISPSVEGFANLVFGDTTVSAAAIYTCVKGNNAVCREYASEADCKANCQESCQPTAAKNLNACKLGTCYDSKQEGTCIANSPQGACTSQGGKWFDDPNGNVKECQKGCCVLGEQALFYTPQQCKYKAAQLGMSYDFRPQYNTELSCLALSRSKYEGACVYEKDFETTCKYTTGADCLQMQGEFHYGYLCSNPQLNTTCTPQAKVDCIDGKDEVFWFDSCGNKENIYDANKVKSFNNGMVLSKNDSCQIASDTNFLANQGTCGNCNYFIGSRCGQKTASQSLGLLGAGVVCRDLSCTDSKGNKRQNGESWCVYQSSIGVDKGRSTDVPGSRHFREVCIDGEVQIEPCADYRNEICSETKNPSADGNGFSTAACRLNPWSICENYNNQNLDRETGSLSDASGCSSNPDCFVKEVNVGDKFKFALCAPRYPPGEDLGLNAGGSAGMCNQASVSCTSVEVKRSILGGGGWQNKLNKECETEKFTEELNDLCMSLGDCGSSVNTQGKLTKNYKVTVKTEKVSGRGSCQSKSVKELSAGYIAGISQYHIPVPGRVAEPSSYSGELGIPEGLGQPPTEEQKDMMAQMIPGMAGIGISALGMIAPKLLGGLPLFGGGAAAAAPAAIPAIAITSGPLASSTLPASVPALPVSGGAAGAAAPAMAALGGGLAGAGIGMAIVSMFMQFGGMSEGYTQAESMALMGMGAIGGGLVGAAVMGGATTSATGAVSGGLGVVGGGAGAAGIGVASLLGIVGGVILAAVIAIMVIDFMSGTGTVCKHKFSFQCLPWQAPTGGADCSKCGKDGLPCSQYTCSALGQTCMVVNEGTDQVECVDMSPNDVSSPIISPTNTNTSSQYPYADSKTNGVRIISNAKNLCIQSYTKLQLGLGLNEPGQCRWSTNANTKFGVMENDFGSGYLFLRNHTMLYVVPSLQELGVTGIDPNRTAQMNLYIKCQDKRGNKNENDYVINLCVSPDNDLTAPEILSRNPSGDYVAYNATRQSMTIYTSEPATCRWDTSDRDYDQMNYISLNSTFRCINGISDQTLGGWRCDTTLPISINNTNFYVRCKDQPWLEYENDTARNKNSQGYRISLQRTQYPLKIESVSPDNETLKFATEPFSIDLKAETSGGLDGTARCEYYWLGTWSNFADTLGRTHTQVFDSFVAGRYNVPVRCTDEAGNVASKSAKFETKIDLQAPQISRVYDQAGTLVVITDEPAECYYSLSSCYFDINNATSMTGADIYHTTVFNKQSLMYIQCKDPYGNFPGGCSMVIRGESKK